MKKKILLLKFVFLTLATYASHFAGGDIDYQCVGPNRYLVRVNFFRDCDGVPAPTATSFQSDFTLSSTCGTTISGFAFNLVNPGGTEISQLCPSALINSTCGNGLLPGMQRYTYITTITLPNTCPNGTWTFSYENGSRNPSVNVPGASSQSWHISASLNATWSCNSSPFFTAQPIPYVCAGQAVNYNYGVVENDGDSLRYSFVAARSGGFISLNYAVGFSAAAPIPGITINPLTGQINFMSPVTQGNYVVVVQVAEYDRITKLLKGVVQRDIQFVVIPCANTAPSPVAGNITSLTINSGSAVLLSSNTIESCEGNSFSWRTVFTDVNLSDQLIVTTNAASVLPGIGFVVSGTNPLTVTWNLTVPPGSAGPFGATKSFVVNVNDQACPIPGLQSFTYNINAVRSTYVGPDLAICGTQTAKPTATGGSIFTWYDLSNILIPVNPTSFSCNPCASPVITPSGIGTYAFVVESNLSGAACKNRDTLIVSVVNNFVPNLLSSDSLCLGEAVLLDANPNPVGSYTYSWSPAIGLNNSFSATPTATFTSGGTFTYTVAITSSQGCTKQDTIALRVSPNKAPLKPNIVQDQIVCVGASTSLTVSFGAGNIPSACALSSTGNCTLTSNFSSGFATGNSTNTTDTPFKGSFQDGRMVSLFRASELLAQGLTAGKIQGLKLEITNKASSIPYNNFTIKMGCTDLEQLTSNFPVGLISVFSANYVTVLGVNAFSFASPYEWDGVSNLLIEICFDNIAVTNVDAVAIETKSYPSSAQNGAFNASGCMLNALNTSMSRPVYTFDWCAASPNVNAFNYAWSPSTYLSATNIYNPVTTPATLPFSYTVLVQDKIGGCEATDTHSLLVASPSLTTFSYLKSTYCKGEPHPSPFGTAVGVGTFTVAPAGLFFLSSITGTINMAATVPKTYTITNTYTGNINCPSIVSTYGITILPAEIVSFDYSSPTYCVNGGFTGTPIKVNPNATGTFSYTANPPGSILALNNQDGNIDLNSSSAGTYTIKFTSDSQCQTTYTRNLTIIALPSGVFSYTNPYCTNGFNALVTLSVGSIAGTYTAIPSTPLLSLTASTGSINVMQSTPGSYTVRNYVTNNFGCKDSSDAQVFIIPADISSFSYSDTVYCYSGVTDPIVMPQYAGTFTTSSPNLSVNPTTGRLNLFSASLGTYTVSFISGGPCPTTYSVPILIQLPYSEIFYTPNTVCVNSGDIIPVNFVPNSITSGSFTFPNGLSADASGTIDVNNSLASISPYIITFTAVNGTCFQNYITSFTIKPKDDASFYYAAQLCNNNTNGDVTVTGVAGGIFSSLDFPADKLDQNSGKLTLIGTKLGTYSIIYNSPISPIPQYCTNSSTFTVNIVEPAIATFTYAGPYCVNNAEFINAIPYTESGYFGYFTSNDPDLKLDSLTGKIDLRNSFPNKDYIITNTLAATAACLPVLDTTNVQLIGPTASFDVTPLTGVVPLNLFISNNSVGATDYKWDFGNYDTSNVINPNYVYKETGDYLIILTAKATETCIDTASAKVHVDGVTTLFIPNSFTPNGDGLNDVFKPSFSYLQSVHIRLFDRWGELIAEWKDLEGSWDGKNKGVDCPIGTYIYKISGLKNTGEAITQNGSITLIR